MMTEWDTEDKVLNTNKYMACVQEIGTVAARLRDGPRIPPAGAQPCVLPPTVNAADLSHQQDTAEIMCAFCDWVIGDIVALALSSLGSLILREAHCIWWGHTNSLMERSPWYEIEVSCQQPAQFCQAGKWASHLCDGSSSPSPALTWVQPERTSWLQPHERLWTRTLHTSCLWFPHPQKRREVQAVYCWKPLGFGVMMTYMIQVHFLFHGPTWQKSSSSPESVSLQTPVSLPDPTLAGFKGKARRVWLVLSCFQKRK